MEDKTIIKYQMYVKINKHLFTEAGVCLFCKCVKSNPTPTCKDRKAINPQLYKFIKFSGYKFNSKTRKWENAEKQRSESLNQLFMFWKSTMQNRL